jgi:flagellar assembly factor FliW
MPGFETKHFGRIAEEPDVVFEFPRGLPGFEERRRFAPLHFERSDPLIFLQSLEDPDLCFLTVPVGVVDPGYRLTMEPEDLELIGLPAGAQPRIGIDVLCLAVISVHAEGPTANLLAPIVVHLRNYQAVQAVTCDSAYSHQHPLLPSETPVCS